ncbi:MAG TPA: DUF2218 domain-containing protein [Actinophytocola sp.]|uniref:DUF2218 domain-containing protein n=1 Tax=Actinophytocola sp. TaxID=1872138 RepID=UPI002DDCD592|nr:DUF2218 domain-containing protein [Actinophytocola sp.]HEV2779072.1 DUF2218 domain-containing protein [Actinophytocola sp.]
MPTVEAHVPTERPSRFLVQLCRHASQMSRNRMIRLPAHLAGDSRAGAMPNNLTAEWSDTHGTVSVDGGTCILWATQDALNLRIDAHDEETLHRMQELITRNLTRFSRRDPLTVTWNRTDAPDRATGAPAAPTGHAAHRRRRTALLIAIAVLAIAAHVVLGGAVLAAPQWTAWAADAVLALVLIKAAILTAGYLTHRRRRAAKSR